MCSLSSWQTSALLIAVHYQAWSYCIHLRARHCATENAARSLSTNQGTAAMAPLYQVCLFSMPLNHLPRGQIAVGGAKAAGCLHVIKSSTASTRYLQADRFLCTKLLDSCPCMGMLRHLSARSKSGIEASRHARSIALTCCSSCSCACFSRAIALRWSLAPWAKVAGDESLAACLFRSAASVRALRRPSSSSLLCSSNVVVTHDQSKAMPMQVAHGIMDCQHSSHLHKEQHQKADKRDQPQHGSVFGKTENLH